MRKIKFRAMVDNDQGQWAYGYYVEYPDGTAYIHAVDGSQLRVKPETLGQYINLDDRYGVEMYEGDIASYVYLKRKTYPSHMKRLVKWGQTARRNGFTIADSTNIEIAGNIYQNKDITFRSDT